MPDNLDSKTCSFDICSQCELCCCQNANPPLTLKRKRMIIGYLQELGQPAERLFVDEAYSHPAADEQGFCTFYNKETKKCRVHLVKPETCKAGPITFDINPNTRKVEWYLKKIDICGLARKLSENIESLNEHFEEAKAEIQHLIFELDSNSLSTILKIEEPQTTKIGENELNEETLEKLNAT
jgi:Fe-S-cluster containining protein